MDFYAKLTLLFLFICYFDKAYSLECYVCSNQSSNTEKCLISPKVCEQHEDVCLTEIRWGTTPYWSQGAEKQYYVSKRCSTRDYCEKLRNHYSPYCTHIWYQDWKCLECCKGDKCNYYVILGGSLTKASFTIILIGISSLLFFNKMLVS